MNALRIEEVIGRAIAHLEVVTPKGNEKTAAALEVMHTLGRAVSKRVAQFDPKSQAHHGLTYQQAVTGEGEELQALEARTP